MFYIYCHQDVLINFHRHNGYQLQVKPTLSNKYLRVLVNNINVINIKKFNHDLYSKLTINMINRYTEVN